MYADEFIQLQDCWEESVAKDSLVHNSDMSLNSNLYDIRKTWKGKLN